LAKGAAKVVAMLVPRAMAGRLNSGSGSTGKLPMPVLAIVAREAAERYQVQGKYVAKPFHAAKVTEGRKSCCRVKLLFY